MGSSYLEFFEIIDPERAWLAIDLLIVMFSIDNTTNTNATNSD